MLNWAPIATDFLKEVFGHEKVKEFKQEFIGATVDWLKPLFLEEIPEEEIANVSPEKMQEKITEMSTNDDVLAKLEEMVEAAKERNIVSGNTVVIKKGNVKIGHGSKKDDVANTITDNDINIGEGDFIIGG